MLVAGLGILGVRGAWEPSRDLRGAPRGARAHGGRGAAAVREHPGQPPAAHGRGEGEGEREAVHFEGEAIDSN